MRSSAWPGPPWRWSSASASCACWAAREPLSRRGSARLRHRSWRRCSGGRRAGRGRCGRSLRSAAAALYVTAWQASGHVAQVAGTILIGGACLAIAGIVGPITPVRYLAIGLVLLVVPRHLPRVGQPPGRVDDDRAAARGPAARRRRPPSLPAPALAAAGRARQLQHGLARLPRTRAPRRRGGPAHPAAAGGGGCSRRHGARVGIPARGDLTDPRHRPGAGRPRRDLAGVVARGRASAWPR